MAYDFANLDIDAAVKAWPTLRRTTRRFTQLFEIAGAATKGDPRKQTKYIDRDALRKQLEQLKRDWPRIRERLAEKMIPRAELHDMLQAAGCPVKSEDIGISPERLRVSFRKAYHIRRRFTILDLVRRANIWDDAWTRSSAARRTKHECDLRPSIAIRPPRSQARRHAEPGRLGYMRPRELSLLAMADSHLGDRRLRAVLFRAQESERRDAGHGGRRWASRRASLGCFSRRTVCCTASRSSPTASSATASTRAGSWRSGW